LHKGKTQIKCQRKNFKKKRGPAHEKGGRRTPKKKKKNSFERRQACTKKGTKTAKGRFSLSIGRDRQAERNQNFGRRTVGTKKTAAEQEMLGVPTGKDQPKKKKRVDGKKNGQGRTFKRDISGRR